MERLPVVTLLPAGLRPAPQPCPVEIRDISANVFTGSCQELRQHPGVRTSDGRIFSGHVGVVDCQTTSLAASWSVVFSTTGGVLSGRTSQPVPIRFSCSNTLYRLLWRPGTQISRVCKGGIDRWEAGVLAHEQGHARDCQRAVQAFNTRPGKIYTASGATRMEIRQAIRAQYSADVATASRALDQDLARRFQAWHDQVGTMAPYPDCEKCQCPPGMVPCDEGCCAAAVSRFDENDEGWTVVGDAEAAAPVYHATGGNPGGYIEITDLAIGGIWYWQAPASFLGDKRVAYGRVLSFDLRQSQLDKQFDADDIKLQGGNPLITLVLSTAMNPGKSWTSYAVNLDPSAGWRDAETGSPATEAQLRGVLTSLSLLQIRGEYRTGDDIGGLDNVVFGAGPPPPPLIS